MSLINSKGESNIPQLLKDKEFQELKEKLIKDKEYYEQEIKSLKAEIAKLQKPKKDSKLNQASSVQIALIFHYMERGGYMEEIAKEAFSNLLAFTCDKSSQNIRTWFTKINTEAAKTRKNLLLIKPYFEEMKLSKSLNLINRDLSEIK